MIGTEEKWVAYRDAVEIVKAMYSSDTNYGVNLAPETLRQVYTALKGTILDVTTAIQD